VAHADASSGPEGSNANPLLDWAGDGAGSACCSARSNRRRLLVTLLLTGRGCSATDGKASSNVTCKLCVGAGGITWSIIIIIIIIIIIVIIVIIIIISLIIIISIINLE
jgi:type IV secretory pathway VirB6-like protein